MIRGGFHGNILRVDLSQKRVSIETLEDNLARDYIGGRGLGSVILWHELPPQTDPLSPGNKLILATGPLNGTGAALSSRYEIVTKSPLTNAILSTNSGGRFPISLKRTGFDALLIEGAAQNPCYLWNSRWMVQTPMTITRIFYHTLGGHALSSTTEVAN